MLTYSLGSAPEKKLPVLSKPMRALSSLGSGTVPIFEARDRAQRSTVIDSDRPPFFRRHRGIVTFIRLTCQ
jgi:hypothetical protein